MKVNEKECILEVLSQLTMEIHDEMTRQDNRADKRVKAGKDCMAADGQATGLEKALKLVESKEKEIRELRVERPTEEQSSEVINFIEMMQLLRAGKKVKVDHKCFLDSSIPTIRVNGTNGQTDAIDLDCIQTEDFDSYIPEYDISSLDTISVVAYQPGSSTKIEYVYANPQMNRLFAHLEDGRDVDYDFSILDVWSAFKGEYIPPKMREVTLTFFKLAGTQRKYYTQSTLSVPESWWIGEIEKYVIETVQDCKDMDIVVNFPSTDKIYFPLLITANSRKYRKYLTKSVEKSEE